MNKVRHISLLLLFLSGHGLLLAGEGMWLPMMIASQKGNVMQSMGLQMDAAELFRKDGTGLNEAILRFGQGCTGSFISPEGLIITNHHCGFGQIQSHSSVEKDYITEGFWAKSREEELANPGLTISVVTSMQDVTREILMDASPWDYQQDTLKARMMSLEKKLASEDVEVQVRSMFNDNMFVAFFVVTFKDVRLVGAPPSSVGSYGRDTDNWMWPRHSGDFCLFRVYADKDNRPAEYAKENVPYRPKRFLPISLKPVVENDFAMVYGFPGRTNQYLHADGVALIRNIEDSIRVAMRTSRLSIWDDSMRANDTIYIKYASKYASVANGWKKWQGEMKGLDKSGAIARKRSEDAVLTEEDIRAGLQKEGLVNEQLKIAYANLRPLLKYRTIYQECYGAVELFAQLQKAADLNQKLKKNGLKDDEREQLINAFKKSALMFCRNYDKKVDLKVALELLPHFESALSPEELQALTDGLKKRERMGFSEWLRRNFLESPLGDSVGVIGLIEKIKSGKDPLLRDELALYSARCLGWYSTKVKANSAEIESEIGLLQSKRMRILMTRMEKPGGYYPDANGTLRISFGKVEGFQPADATRYHYYTTSTGILAKENPELEEFTLPNALKEKLIKQDFGPYAYPDGTLRVNFISSCHTTGGNSGSPVMNGKGEMIGINFDRCWEGTMSDLNYDISRCRNISADMHYVLFIVDKVGGAGYLIDEMKVVR